MLAQLISAYSVVDTDKAKSYPFKTVITSQQNTGSE